MTLYVEITLVASICTVVAWSAVLLRIWTRLRIVSNGLGLDDWTMMASLVFFTLLCAACQFIAECERRNPILSVPVANTILMLIMVGEVLFMLATITLKISLTVFFLQFLLERWQRHTIVYAGAIHCIVSFAAMFLGMFRCGLPVDMAVKSVNGQCVPRDLFNILLYGHGTISILSDWVYAALPILVLRKSNLPRMTKVSASALLILAVAGSIAAIARTINTGLVAFRMAYYDPNHHPTYYRASSTELDLAIAEIGCGIVAASLACLRPLALRLTGRWIILVSKLSCCSLMDHDIDRKRHPVRIGSVERVPRQVLATATLPKSVDADARQYSVEMARIDGMTRLGILSTVDMNESESLDRQSSVGMATTTDKTVDLEHV